MSAIESVGPHPGAHGLKLLGDRITHEMFRHIASVIEPHAVPEPLPHLGAADFRCRSILHQVIDRDAAESTEPRLQILDADVNVVAQPLLGDRAFMDGKQVVRADLYILS